MSGTFLIFILLGILMSIGVPIGISLGAATLLTMVLTTDLNVITITQNCFRGLDSFPLMAIPFFILAGNLMRSGGISNRLLKLCYAIIGGIKGGLGMVTVLACMFFAALSGSAPATVTAIGSSMIPAMKENDYDKSYASALTATAGSIGVIIPPSIPFVIYGVVSGTSVGDLFLAGLLPGFLITAALMITNYVCSRKAGYGGTGESFNFKKLWLGFKDSIWALLVPVIILGGIYGGIFSPTEAAVVGVVYSLIIGLFVYKELDRKSVYQAFRETVQINGSTNFMVGLSLSFAAFLTLARVPEDIALLIVSFTSNKIIILILLNILLLVVGCFIDNISSTIILTPILLPIAVNLGVDPIQFGIILTINLAIGFVTPPYGVNLFFASSLAKIPIEEISKKILPFIFAMLIVLFLVTYIPAVSMFLPDLIAK